MLRFRLKTLMIWFAVLSVLLAWASNYLLPSYRERDRIAEVLAVGAQVYTEPRGQFFLRQVIGDSLSERAVYVHLRDPRVTDDWLVHLQGLKYIEVLSINSANVSDVGLRHLRALPNLRNLNLVNTKTTKSGVRSLQEALPLLQRAVQVDIVNGEFVHR
jgi:hypothetical protein